MTIYETEIAQPITDKGNPIAFVVRMSPFSPNWPASNVRDQLERAFPGIPVIFVDHSTTVEAIHAAE